MKSIAEIDGRIDEIECQRVSIFAGFERGESVCVEMDSLIK